MKHYKYYIDIKGVRIPFWIQKKDFSAIGENSNVLVKFNNKGIVSVDKTADDAYAYYAGAHECICMGCYKSLAPSVKNPDDRCGAIDLMLMEKMSLEYREIYRKKRIKMFETLIDKDLSPSRNKSFKRSIEILQSGRVD